MLKPKEVNTLLKILIEDRKILMKEPKTKQRDCSKLYKDGKIFALQEVMNPTDTTKRMIKDFVTNQTVTYNCYSEAE